MLIFSIGKVFLLHFLNGFHLQTLTIFLAHFGKILSISTANVPAFIVSQSCLGVGFVERRVGLVERRVSVWRDI